MPTYTFKTTINCGNCIAAVTPTLNQEAAIQHWEVDLESDDRILTVETDTLAPAAIQTALAKIGFQAQPI